MECNTNSKQIILYDVKSNKLQTLYNNNNNKL